MKLEGYLHEGKFYTPEQLKDRTFPAEPVYSGDLKEFAREAIDLGLSLGSKADWGIRIDDKKELIGFMKENVIE